MTNLWRVYWVVIDFNSCGDELITIQRLYQPHRAGYKQHMYSMKNKPASFDRLMRVLRGHPMLPEVSRD